MAASPATGFLSFAGTFVTQPQDMQLGFAFLAELPTLDLAPPKRAARPPKSAPAKSAAASKAASLSAPLEPEAMAAALQAHPDYRVLRRLKPCLDWPGAAQGTMRRILVLDTETTGLDPSKEKIIELALLRVDVDTATGLPIGPVQVYDGLQDPDKPIPPEVVAITGITDADVQGQSLDESRVKELMEGVEVVIAHNAGFDRPFVEARLPTFAQLDWACSFADIDWKAQGRGSAKLESLAQALGLFYDAHRAEMDCHALLAVLAQPLPHAEQPQHTGLAHLLRAAGQPSFRLSATQAPFEAKDQLRTRGYRWNAEQRVWVTRLNDEGALQSEYAWLKAHVYGNRQASVQVETLDARTKYSARVGALTYPTI